MFQPYPLNRAKKTHQITLKYPQSISKSIVFFVWRQQKDSFFSALWHSRCPLALSAVGLISSAKTFCASLHSRSLFPAGRIVSLITAAVTQHTGLIPDRKISVTATLSLTSGSRPPSVSAGAVPCHWEAMGWGELRFLKVLFYTPRSDGEPREENMVAGIHVSAEVARKHCQSRSHFKG